MRNADAMRIVDETLPIAERLELTRETIELIITRGAVAGGSVPAERGNDHPHRRRLRGSGRRPARASSSVAG